MRTANRVRMGGGAVVAAAVAAFACSSSKPAGTADAGPVGTGVPCTIQPGQLPPATCDDSSGDCSAPAAGQACVIDEAKCGSASTCLPMADNRGKQVLDFRMRRIQVVAPPQLAEVFVQNLIVGRNVDLAAPSCADPNGKGSFTWLIRIDKTRNKLTTGGAPPSADPFGLGYCFTRGDVGAVTVGPVDLDLAIDGNKVTPTSGFPKLNVPIYVNGDVNNVVLLPISNGRVQDITLSGEGNCIGRFDLNGVDSRCEELKGSCSKWKTSGTLGGYITLEEADKVILRDLDGRTLCGYLTGNTSTKACARDGAGKISAKGDFCSTSNKAGECADAYWLAATFTAAAVKIHDGAGVPQCGAGPVDAGRD